MGLRGQSPRALFRGAAPLRAAGLVERHDDELRLTPAGRAAASNVVRKHRLWELYLTRRLELPADHVHRDAEAMEHVLSPAVTARLADLLGHPETDPHGRPIPPLAEEASP
jgi:Mn-dependent DtxR family transcriptional regulator